MRFLDQIRERETELSLTAFIRVLGRAIVAWWHR